MPFFRINGMRMHLKLSGKKSTRLKPCCARDDAGARCEAIATRLCDWPVEGGTCDAPLCSDHAMTVVDDRHYCPIHAKRDHNPKQGDLEL